MPQDFYHSADCWFERFGYEAACLLLDAQLQFVATRKVDLVDRGDLSNCMTSTESASQLKHDADLAGGAKEVVFASDGVDVPPIIFPINARDEDLVDSETMTAEQAFEVFAGKLFVANPYNKKRNATTEESNESPLDRLGRLKRELDELEKDCASMDESNVLQDRLVELQGQFQRVSTSRLEQQSSLLSSIQTSVDKLKGTGTDDRGESNATSSSLGVGSPELEVRINRLEKMLGSSSLSVGSLLDRLEKLEGLQSKLDDKKIDLLQRRVKVIRQDLEAAAKARNKLASSTASSEDSKTIAALYDQLQQLQGLSQHLPILTARLEALAHQHVDVATRAARFHSVEQIASSLQNHVQSMETAMTAVDASMQQNASAMLENIAALEARMKAF